MLVIFLSVYSKGTVLSLQATTHFLYEGAKEQ